MSYPVCVSQVVKLGQRLLYPWLIFPQLLQHLGPYGRLVCKCQRDGHSRALQIPASRRHFLTVHLPLDQLKTRHEGTRPRLWGLENIWETVPRLWNGTRDFSSSLWSLLLSRVC